jgi:hypothetical protein
LDERRPLMQRWADYLNELKEATDERFWLLIPPEKS